MLRQHHRLLSNVFRYTDVLIVLVTFWVLYCFQIQPSVKNITGLPSCHQAALLINMLIWIYLAKRMQLYASKRLSTFASEVRDVIKATTPGVAVASIPVFMTLPDMGVASDWTTAAYLNVNFFVSLWILQISCFVSLRFVLRKCLRYIRSRGYNFRNVLLVGCNSRAAVLAREIEETPGIGMRILGFLDASNGSPYCKESFGYKCFGSLEDLESTIRSQVVDEVIIALPIKSFYSEMEKVINCCESVGLEVKIPIHLFNPNVSKITVSNYLGLLVIDLYSSPKMTYQLWIKRFMDVCITLLSLILLFPLFIVIPLFIKGTSKGPVFFRQQRVGYNGRIFTCLKFRTMVENAEQLKKELWGLNEMDGPVFKIKNDRRVTKVGRLLRKTSMDELPQLINVLKGEMSLVGPRPPVPSEVEEYDLMDRRRLSMRPGMTGIWQVSGRNGVSFKKWMEMDREYIDRWSLWLDLKILARTIPAVFKGIGAA